MATNEEIRAKDILPHKTSFSAGDGFYGDGPTSFFMEANKLLELTAQDALAGNVVLEFDPTRTNENAYSVGDKVVYEGKIYVFLKRHYGNWNISDVSRYDIFDSETKDELDLKGSCLVSVVKGSYLNVYGDQLAQADYDINVYIVDDRADSITVTARIGSSAAVCFYDKDGVFISSFIGGSVSLDVTEDNFINGFIPIPQGTALVKIPHGIYADFAVIIGNSLIGKIENIYEASVNSVLAAPPLRGILEGRYIAPDGTIYPQEDYNVNTYEVSSIDSFFITAKIGSASCILFIDEQNEIVSYISGRSISGVNEPNFINEKILIPAGAKWVRIGYGTTAVFKFENSTFVQRVREIVGDSKLNGKKVAFIGDSITAGVGASTGNGYVNKVADITGCVPINLGVSSTCIANNTKNGLGSSRFVTRATSANLSDVDLVVVFGGTNDLSYDSKAIGEHFYETTITASGNIGTKQLEPVSDTDTFSGALHDLIVTIQSVVKPNTPIMFVTPLHRNNHQVTNPNSYQCNSNGDYMIDFVNAMKDICAFYGVPVLDLYSDGEINPLVPNYSGLFSDGLHPNNNGHRVIAERIASFVEKNISFIS